MLASQEILQFCDFLLSSDERTARQRQRKATRPPALSRTFLASILRPGGVVNHKRRCAVILGCPLQENRGVLSPGHINHDRIRVTFGCVILLQFRAQPPRLNAHDRVRGRVEGFAALEDIHAERILIQRASRPLSDFARRYSVRNLLRLGALAKVGLWSIRANCSRTLGRECGTLVLDCRFEMEIRPVQARTPPA